MWWLIPRKWRQAQHTCRAIEATDVFTPAVTRCDVLALKDKRKTERDRLYYRCEVAINIDQTFKKSHLHSSSVGRSYNSIKSGKCQNIWCILCSQEYKLNTYAYAGSFLPGVRLQTGRCTPVWAQRSICSSSWPAEAAWAALQWSSETWPCLDRWTETDSKAWHDANIF